MIWAESIGAALLFGVAGAWAGYELGGTVGHAALMGGAWAVVVLLLYRRIA